MTEMHTRMPSRCGPPHSAFANRYARRYYRLSADAGEGDVLLDESREAVLADMLRSTRKYGAAMRIRISSFWRPI